MKKLAILVTFCLLFLQTKAQPGKWKSYKKNHQQTAGQLAQNKATLLLGDNDALHLINSTSDELGFKHYRYQQYYKGIPIEGAIYLVHEKAGKVTLSNGQLISELDISAKPTLNETTASKLAIGHVPAKLYAWQSKAHEEELKRSNQNSTASYFPKGNLTILDPRFTQLADNYSLAYKFNVFALAPFAQKEVFVDAHSGEILLELNNLHSCTETTVNAASNYSGNVNVSVCIENEGPSYLKSTLYGGLEIRDMESNNLLTITDKLGAEVLWATQQSFDYFTVHHNRNIADTLTISKINNSGDAVGAFYLSSLGEIIYNKGNGTTHNAYTTPDIVGHELTHGINKFSADLINRYESGALNESFADIFGELVEYHCTGSTDWILGAAVSPTHQGLRNLANPKDETMKTRQPTTYLGENWILPSSACIRNNDQCGVHRNNGVQNYWFYLLAEGGTGTNDNNFQYSLPGIGKEKAAQIAYRNLTTYLTPSATYIDARQGSIQSAIDLFGKNSIEVEQTEKAWRAVGVLHNPIQLQTVNETVLEDGSFQFELLVDSLKQDISTDGLIIQLDAQDNYDVVSVEVVHPGLLIEEVKLNHNTISINRIDTQYLTTNEPLFKIVATLKTNALKTVFEIKGGTTFSNADFVAYEAIFIDIPIENCSGERKTSAPNTNAPNFQNNARFTANTQAPNLPISTHFAPNTFAINTHTPNTPNMLIDISENHPSPQNTPNTQIAQIAQNLSSGIPLITSIIYESCVETGSVIVKILNTKSTPYAHIWRDAEGTIVYEYVGYEQVIEVPNLAAGLYQVTVSDTAGNCKAFDVKISLLAYRHGNNLCNNRCPNYLVTPAGNLQGTFNAKLELEIKGYVSASQNASFNICN